MPGTCYLPRNWSKNLEKSKLKWEIVTALGCSSALGSKTLLPEIPTIHFGLGYKNTKKINLELIRKFFFCWLASGILQGALQGGMEKMHHWSYLH